MNLARSHQYFHQKRKYIKQTSNKVIRTQAKITSGGGLYARAGLGRGGPEAAAGLGGKLDGSGRSANPISGGLYAGATPGGGPGPGVFLGGGVDQPGFDGIISGSAANEANLNPPAGTTTIPASADAGGTKPKGRTNIQIIRSRAQKEKEVSIAIP